MTDYEEKVKAIDQKTKDLAAYEARITIVNRGVWEVNLWGSHPEQNNDDCITGMDFDNRGAAEAAWAKLSHSTWGTKGQLCFGATCAKYIELNGPDVYLLRINPDYVNAREHDDGEAMMIGMGLGIDAYNEAIGSPLTGEER